MGFSRQECWRTLPFSSPGDLPDPEIKSGSPTLLADSLPPEPLGKPQEPLFVHVHIDFYIFMVTLWTVAHQASSVHGILQARILDGLPFTSPGDLPNPGIKPTSPALAGRFFTTEPPGKPPY